MSRVNNVKRAHYVLFDLRRVATVFLMPPYCTISPYICILKLWLCVHSGFASSPHSPPHPVWACQAFGSSGSVPSIGLSLSLCADSHAWTRSCYTIPKRYERNINCHNHAIRRPDQHLIHHCIFCFFRLLLVKPQCIDIKHNRKAIALDMLSILP